MQPVVLCSLRTGDISGAIRRLTKAGITGHRISVFAPSVEVGERASKEQPVEGLASATRLVVTDVGPFTIAGPVARMLVGQPDGRLVSDLTVSVADLIRLIGLSGEAASRLEKRLRGGWGVVLAQGGAARETVLAMRVFEQLGGLEIETCGKIPRRGPTRRAAAPA